MRGEVVVITGGSGGIGLAAAHRFAAAGARVVLVARDRAKLDRAVAEVGGRARAVSADVTRPQEVEALAADVEAAEGRVDVLVNAAGVFEIGRAEELGPEMARRLMEINYLAPIRTLHAFLPLLRKAERRSIVNVTSLAGKLAPPYMAAYAGSKFGLAGYTHVLRQELRPEGFHVGLVVPGPVDTGMIEGKVRGPYYPLLPGVTMSSAGRAGRVVFRLVQRRRAEAVLPAHLGPVARLGAAFPRLVDLAYRRYVVG